MQIQELKEILASINEANGDLVHVEGKLAKGGFPKRLWETLSAFANTPSGGIVLLGWDEETREINGVNDPKKMQQDLASLCDQMVPPLRPLIQVHTIDGKKVVTAEVPEV